MNKYTPILRRAIFGPKREPITARFIAELESLGWTAEVLHPGVTRLRHPQVETATGSVSVERAVEIQGILTEQKTPSDAGVKISTQNKGGHSWQLN